MLEAKTLQQWLQAAFPDAKITVEGDDGRHFSAIVDTQAFRGMTALAQHRAVYEALGDKMHTQIHALSLETRSGDHQ